MTHKPGLLFGTGGTPLSSRSSSTVAGIERIAELGLDCMEVQFVQGVRMGEKLAGEVGQTAQERGVELSVHAPYFVNLNAHEPEKIAASQERLLQSARIGAIFGARSVVFHAAFYLGDPPGEVYELVKTRLAETVAQLRAEGNRVCLRPEVTGKSSQFGSLEEVLALSADIDGVYPCIDFAHQHARTGANNSYEEFVAVLDRVQARLGRAALDNIHIHFSGIAYSKAGELRHLNLGDADLRYQELLKALKDREVRGMVICESPSLEGDAQLLKREFNNLP
ncbi:MAG: TIM barrel protein [Chloroflexi bacterium]|nr:TIM barrel protein [Chloroflexota bacterium]